MTHYQFNKFNKTISIFSFFICASLTVNAKDPSLECIQQTCGVVNPLAHPFDIQPDLAKTTRLMIDIKMKKSIQNYMGRIIHKALIKDKAYKAIDSKSVKLTTEQSALIQSITYMGRLRELSTTVEVVNGRYAFNRDKLKSLLINPTNDELDAVSSLAIVFSVAQNLQGFSRFSYDTNLKMLYPGKTTIEAQKAAALSIKEVQDKISKIIILYKELQDHSLVIEKAINSENLSVAEQKIMLSQIELNYFLNTLLSDQIQNSFAKVPLDLEKTLNEKNKKYNESEVALAIKTPQTIKNILQTTVAQCSAKLAYSYAALPTKQQLIKFSEMVSIVQNTAQQMIEQKIKMSLPEAFRSEIALPTAQDFVIDEWQNYLQVGTADSDMNIKKLKAVDLNDPLIMNSFVVNFILEEKKQLFSDVLSFCEKAEPPFLNDAAIPMLNSINLSWPTIRHPEIGLAIVAHEIGHVASSKWPESVKAEKSCLAQIQGTPKYVEEDFADLFSAEIFNRLNGSVTDTKLKNLGCGLQSILLPGTLKNQNPSDSHSSGFYRMLAFSKMTRQKISSCDKFIEDNNVQNIFGQYCQWQ